VITLTSDIILRGDYLSKKRKRQREREVFTVPGVPEAPEEQPKKVKVKYSLLLDPAKIAWLLRASETPMKVKTRPDLNLDYPTYTQDQVQGMILEYLSRPPTKPKF
jgi:hypothetical protein